jgi:hypothetical protein
MEGRMLPQEKSAAAEIASRIAAAQRSNDDAVAVPGLEGSGVEQRWRPVDPMFYATHGIGAAPPDGSLLPPSEWSPTEGKPVETIGQPKAANSNGLLDDVARAAERVAQWRNESNYTTLRTILDAAFDHAATGKGKERHARDLPFDEQPMLETTRLVGAGFPLGQAIKKAGEAAGMIERGQYDAAEAECLGAINYLAGAVAWMREVSEGKVAA